MHAFKMTVKISKYGDILAIDHDSSISAAILANTLRKQEDYLYQLINQGGCQISGYVFQLISQIQYSNFAVLTIVSHKQSF